ncbi:MAG: DUF523 domain-containing protein [Syntrophobacteraceae bacterium]
MKETVVASACCCGITCRWNGRKTYKSKVIRTLESEGIEVVPVCPEMLGGLPCPRPPVKTSKGRVFATDPETRTEIGEELTEAFERGAQEALRIAKEAGAQQAYFMKMSPSCAPSGIAVKLFKRSGVEVIPIL